MVRGCTSLSAQYRHLALDDRIQIQTQYEKGASEAQISREIGVHRSTITRELTRRAWQPEQDHANLRPY
ncbi:hypothetical protein CVV68_21530 [Arthrobacter livingstonensis]|uniref:Transposase IS30-like HTH domain-containing protein n=1 Tax=Arthrobacter livingstonensis TaxID=670078 RepID=A0A2V5L056_9MICC|nr:hypothetical protein CVV68_21530 [Arthrobacter livingstonensis]